MIRVQAKSDILLRLKRIEGQVRGLQKMVETGKPCPDILLQVAAVTAAIKKVGSFMVQAYLEECLEKSGQETRTRKINVLKDLHKAVSRYIDWS